MPEPQLLATKLYLPAPPPKAVVRPRLLCRLQEGLQHKLTLVSAPAGFGKTTAVCAWVGGCGRPAAWLSLSAADGTPARFLTYLIAALQTVEPQVGQGLLGPVQSPQPPSTETVLTALLNELAGLAAPLVLVLDDYHVLDSEPIDQAVAFLLEHLPPTLHLVIVTREDPRLPLARLRAGGQLAELRAADLRFSATEAAEFLNEMMGLALSAAAIAALEARTEGWVAGLQLAAISLRGQADAGEFIASFSGSHRFVLDYLVEEVLHRQPHEVQAFLLQTAVLERLCGALCDAVLDAPAGSSAATLEYLEQANLFIIPLDSARHWFRYHHLFADLLRQRLHQQHTQHGADLRPAHELHARASHWFEAQGLEIEAFQHAAAAGDLRRAEALVMGNGRPLYVRGGLAPIRQWLETLTPAQFAAQPSLSMLYAMVLAVAGQMRQVEAHLQAAETALASGVAVDDARDLIGRIASLRALVALLARDPGQLTTIIEQAQRALEYLAPDNLSERSGNLWKLGLAYQVTGQRTAARQAFTKSIAAAERSDNTHIDSLATTGLGNMQEFACQLSAAEQSYRKVLHLLGEPPGPVGCEAHLGLARLAYERDDLVAAQQHAELSAKLAQQIEISNIVASELFLVQLQLARGEVAAALGALAQIERRVREGGFWFRMPDVATQRVRALLQHGDLPAAAEAAEADDLPESRARVALAGGDAATALALLQPLHERYAAPGWESERFRLLAQLAPVHLALGDDGRAQECLAAALALAEPAGYLRSVLDEGAPMLRLLHTAAASGVRPAYVARLLSAAGVQSEGTSPPSPSFVEPLSRRELEVLQLIAQGRSNREIGEQLYLALDTVKGHNRAIFGKLQVQRRTEAVARARELGLI